MNRILLVEDDSNVREMVYDYLTGEDYHVTTVENGSEAVRCFEQNAFDLILLDLMLPGCNGMEIIKSVRKISTIPIIIVTARDNDSDKALGLHLGADDYITKPFSFIELTARIRSNIRRATDYSPSALPQDYIIKIRDLEIDTKSHIVKKCKTPLNLTYTEFEILRLLASNPGTAFSKEQLYQHIWKEPYYGNENVLNAHMSRLRNKLKTKSAKDEPIKTLWGIGYKMEDF